MYYRKLKTPKPIRITPLVTKEDDELKVTFSSNKDIRVTKENYVNDWTFI